MPDCPKCKIGLIETHVLLEAMRYDQLHRTKGTDGIRYFCPKCKAEYCTENFMSEAEINKEAEELTKSELAFIHRDEFVKIKQEILEQKFGIIKK